MCSLVCQRDGDEVRVLDEIVLSTSSTPEVCREFIERWGHHLGGHHLTGNSRTLTIYDGDASGAAGNTASGNSDYQVIKKFFRDLATPSYR